MIKKIVFFVLGISFLNASDNQVDFRVDTDPSNLDHRTSFNVATTTSVMEGNHSILICPEMTFYTSGGVDFSVAMAHRHRFKGFVLGHQVFFDRSNTRSFDTDQIGTGFDLLTNQFDFRVNYYQPIRSRGVITFKSSKWMDAEILFKTKYFGVGTGPLYNFNMKEWALHSRLVIPMKGFSVNFGALCGQSGLSQALVSISFHLFKPNHSSALISPPGHVKKSSIYYNSACFFDGLNNPMVEVRDMQDFHQDASHYIHQSEEEMTFQKREAAKDPNKK